MIITPLRHYISSKDDRYLSKYNNNKALDMLFDQKYL